MFSANHKDLQGTRYMTVNEYGVSYTLTLGSAVYSATSQIIMGAAHAVLLRYQIQCTDPCAIHQTLKPSPIKKQTTTTNKSMTIR